ncbi:glucose-6-phosphate isomerase family protein [Thermogemmatispora carboxidivorans]|uniref:glucose-6-phosphate isomerase family protein n=1 Tax=Thermogemmatispora carboxidivorans TaxID=1382306 RepID=UPI000699B6A2|nr:glucose-6-phosphate isomerase family protein [Thermogemmatispora carboxidivorans]
MDPFSLTLDITSGQLKPATSHVQRRLSHMRGMYGDAVAEQTLLEQDDPLIYEVFQYDVPNDNGQLLVCTTVLYPGQVGNEYYMTKGHYHVKADAAEVYLVLSGCGKLLMQVDDRFSVLDIGPGTVAYVPPYWAHRTVNTGRTPCVFLAVYPADAGHDYGRIERDGFLQRVVAHAGEPRLISTHKQAS